MNPAKNHRTGTMKAAVVATALLVGLAACGSPQAAPTMQGTTLATPSATLSATQPSSPPPVVPAVIGKTVGEIRPTLQALNIHIAFKGPDGNVYDEMLVTVPDSAKISGAVPAVGSPVPKGNMLVLDIDVTQQELYAAQTAASAKASADAAAASAKASADAAAAAAAQRAIPRNTFGDGTYVVGKDIQPGTYQVQVPSGANGVHDCYWERTTPQGGTVANDFITFAPEGPIVTIYAGEGFVSERCGTWSKIG